MTRTFAAVVFLAAVDEGALEAGAFPAVEAGFFSAAASVSIKTGASGCDDLHSLKRDTDLEAC